MISRLIKGRHLYFKKYETRKDFRNQKFSPFLMKSSKGRTKIRKYENRVYRRKKFIVDNHKKHGVNYRWTIF